MTVVYNDPNGAAGTFHPKLGYLESGKLFELSDDTADKYIASGLLKKPAVEEPAVVEEGAQTEEASEHPEEVELPGATESSETAEFPEGEIITEKINADSPDKKGPRVSRKKRG